MGERNSIGFITDFTGINGDVMGNKVGRRGQRIRRWWCELFDATFPYENRGRVRTCSLRTPVWLERWNLKKSQLNCVIINLPLYRLFITCKKYSRQLCNSTNPLLLSKRVRHC